MTGPQDVLAAGATTLIGTVNPGLGIGSFGAARGAFSFTHPGEDVKSASLALDRSGRPVQAYFDLGDDPFAADSSVLAYRYTGTGSVDDEHQWSGPARIATGVEPVLSGGAAGLFLVDVDTPAGSDSPTLLDLRKDDGAAFGPPVTLSDDPGAELFDAGAAAQSPGGRLAILWPQTRSGDGLKVMRLFTSTDGGASFAQTDVATLGDSYLGDRNAAAAVGDDGTGAVAYVDDGGLELADFTPVAPFVAPPPPPVIAPPGSRRRRSSPARWRSRAGPWAACATRSRAAACARARVAVAHLPARRPQGHVPARRPREAAPPARAVQPARARGARQPPRGERAGGGEAARPADRAHAAPPLHGLLTRLRQARATGGQGARESVRPCATSPPCCSRSPSCSASPRRRERRGCSWLDPDRAARPGRLGRDRRLLRSHARRRRRRHVLRPLERPRRRSRDDRRPAAGHLHAARRPRRPPGYRVNPDAFAVTVTSGDTVDAHAHARPVAAAEHRHHRQGGRGDGRLLLDGQGEHRRRGLL